MWHATHILNMDAFFYLLNSGLKSEDVVRHHFLKALEIRRRAFSIYFLYQERFKIRNGGCMRMIGTSPSPSPRPLLTYLSCSPDGLLFESMPENTKHRNGPGEKMRLEAPPPFPPHIHTPVGLSFLFPSHPCVSLNLEYPI